MEDIIENSFGVNLILMRILNLYPPENPTLLYKLKAYCVFFVLLPPVPILGALYFLFEENLTTEELNENAFAVAQLGCQVTKFLPFVVNGTRIKNCILYFKSSEFKISVDKQQKIIDDCCWICRRNSTVFLVSITGGVIFFALKPLFSDKQQFPTDIWLPFEPKTDLRVFVVVYLYVFSGVAYAAFSCAAIDPLIAGLAGLAIGQLGVLKDNLQHMNGYTENSKTERKKFIREIIKKSVDQHNAILRFIFEYEACFSMSVFSQFMGSILVICFCCLQLSKSNSLTNAIYMGNWYECDIESKKSLTVLMERSKRPVTIKAGNLLEISIATFTTILRRSYSLLAVLRNF